jgi:hypothetical protein
MAEVLEICTYLTYRVCRRCESRCAAETPAVPLSLAEESKQPLVPPRPCHGVSHTSAHTRPLGRWQIRTSMLNGDPAVARSGAAPAPATARSDLVGPGTAALEIMSCKMPSRNRPSRVSAERADQYLQCPSLCAAVTSEAVARITSSLSRPPVFHVPSPSPTLARSVVIRG